MAAETLARLPGPRDVRPPLVWCIDAAAVSAIRRGDDSCWRWTVTVDDRHDLATDDGRVTLHYRTDSNGDGLWLDYGRGPLDHQLLDHAQWSLAGVSTSTRRRRVLKAMALRHGWDEPA